MQTSATKFISRLSRFAFAVGCVFLYLISLWIFVAATIGIVKDFLGGDFTVYNLLDEVGLIIFAIAVIDVAQYLVREEVLRTGEKSPVQVRRTFTRFVNIIVTALSLEGLVLTIESAKTERSEMIYPVLLFFVATFFLIGLGIYQRLNASAEK